MGTSLAYTGTNSAAANDLRDAISGWLEDGDTARPIANDAAQVGSAASGLWGSTGGARSSPIRIYGSGSGGTGGTAGRSAVRVSRSASRGGSLANAFIRGDRAPFDALGIDFDRLRSLGDPAQVASEIIAAGLERAADESIEDAEEREIVAYVVQWTLEFPADNPPSAEDIARKTIEEMIAFGTLTEVGDTIRQNLDRAERQRAEAEVRRAAEACAAGVDFTMAGSAQADIERAVLDGIADLTRIYGNP